MCVRNVNKRYCRVGVKPNKHYVIIMNIRCSLLSILRRTQLSDGNTKKLGIYIKVGIHKSTSLMSSSLLLQQCPACLVRLT